MVDDILKKYPNDVKVVIKNFPLSFHKQARLTAQYCLAAREQGKYKELYHKIFENYKQLRNNEDLPMQLAAEMGLNVDQLKTDAATKEIDDLINEYKDQIRILKSEVAELQDAGKSKDAANKRCLQKLEFSNKDLEDSQIKVKELEKKLKEEKKTSKMMLEHP